MSQAEIAGGSLSSPNELPVKGRRLHDFELRSSVGNKIRLSDFRGRSSLVLVFTDDRQQTTELLAALAARYPDFKHEQAEVLAIAIAGQVEQHQNLRLPYPVLLDEHGRVHREFGATDAQEQAAAAVYVTDRFGEVIWLYRTREGQKLPTAIDLLSWVEFINNQCPECEPPEWPV